MYACFLVFLENKEKYYCFLKLGFLKVVLNYLIFFKFRIHDDLELYFRLAM